MIKSALLAALFTLSLSAQADSNRPATPDDLVRINQLQRRVDKLAFGPLGPNGYTLSKARAWLDMALIEYHQQENTGIVQDAVAQATQLIDALTDNPMYVSLDTPLPEASEKVRPDLWEKAEALKKRGNLTCEGRKIAELEVQLVWTGHYKWESGWSHAEPSARIAENLAYEAQFEFDPNPCTTFVKPGAPVAAATPAQADIKVAAPIAAPLPALTVPVKPAPAPTPKIITKKHVLPADVLFAPGQDWLTKKYLQRGGRKVLDKMVTELEAWKKLKHVKIIGHTDRLEKIGIQQRTAARHADQIRRHLIKRGIPAQLIEAKGAGASQPLVKCPDRRNHKALVKCLEPNRRIEVIIEGVRK